MIIRYSDGSYVKGVMRRLVGGNLRVTVAGADDAVDFKLIRGAWTSDRGWVVTFEILAETRIEHLGIMPAMNFSEQQAHCEAGGDCMLRRMTASGGGESAN